MTESEKENTSIFELSWILIQNFLVMFMIASAVGFTMGAIGVLTVQTDLYLFTTAFSMVWGMAGAGYAWKREAADIQLPGLFESMLDAVGLKGSSENQSVRFLHSLAGGFSDHLFIPGVKHPSI